MEIRQTLVDGVCIYDSMILSSLSENGITPYISESDRMQRVRRKTSHYNLRNLSVIVHTQRDIIFNNDVRRIA